MLKNLLFLGFLICLNLSAADRYLVKWETTEKCYECSVQYAVACIGTDPGCGTPTKTVYHYREFNTLKEALAFSNPPPPDSPNLVTYNGIMIYGTQPPEQVPTSARQVIGIFLVREIPIEKTTLRTETPQAPKVEEKVTIVLKKP